ncbi:peroxiredoxin [Bradyrhizobium sp. I71]|uniref:peroxiredoxin n=1 Tax=Bradyrhizobium sp. I71 TaxID=2590772 RepID=UPI001EF96224|nr:peroxiredoxin [Bradyrhizobium sp. I71]ULK98519.1 peroxiredoxin [Bradyrhizobium sp. I71]
MFGIDEKVPEFKVVGVKPGFENPQENDESAFEVLTEKSFPSKWKILFFYPKDFTFVCPTEIAEFAQLSNDFAKRGAIVLGGSTDNEFVKLAWRREHKSLRKLRIWQFADNGGLLASSLGIRSSEGVAHRYTYIIDPENVIQHVYATSLSVGRAPHDTLRVLDALQTNNLCACSRPVGGPVLTPADP